MKFYRISKLKKKYSNKFTVIVNHIFPLLNCVIKKKKNQVASPVRILLTHSSANKNSEIVLFVTAS